MAGRSVEIQSQWNSIMSHSPATPSTLWVSSFIYSIIILFMDVRDIRPFYLWANPSFKNWLDSHEILINLYDIVLCFFVLLRHEIFTLWQKTHTSILITLQNNIHRCNELCVCVYTIPITKPPTHNDVHINQKNEGLEVIKFIRLKHCHQKSYSFSLQWNF